jgi:hypothetical protein
MMTSSIAELFQARSRDVIAGVWIAAVPRWGRSSMSGRHVLLTGGGGFRLHLCRRSRGTAVRGRRPHHPRR